MPPPWEHAHLGATALALGRSADIQLNVKGLKTLEDSFKDYIQVETMDGENKYMAEGFGLQVRSRRLFVSLPELSAHGTEADPPRTPPVAVNAITRMHARASSLSACPRCSTCSSSGTLSPPQAAISIVRVGGSAHAGARSNMAISGSSTISTATPTSRSTTATSFRSRSTCGST